LNEKISRFIKTYWKYLTGFAAAIVPLICFHRGRGFLSQRDSSGVDDARNELDELGRNIEEAGTQADELGELNTDASNTADAIQREVVEIGNDNRDAITVSAEIGSSIQRIKRLIEDERKRIEGTQDKE
jgi:hypothetical protein